MYYVSKGYVSLLTLTARLNQEGQSQVRDSYARRRGIRTLDLQALTLTGFGGVVARGHARIYLQERRVQISEADT
jgi:hypothetical protein